MPDPIAQFVASCLERRLSYRDACEEFRRLWIEEALRRAGKNQCALADEIGVHRNTLSRMIRSLHVQIPEGKKKMRHHDHATV